MICEVQPYTYEGYWALASKYPLIVALPQHDDLYGMDDADDARNLITLEMWWVKHGGQP